jgi:hypothetical protein
VTIVRFWSNYPRLSGELFEKGAKMSIEIAQKFWAQNLAEIHRLVMTKDRAGYEMLLLRFLLKQR